MKDLGIKRWRGKKRRADENGYRNKGGVTNYKSCMRKKKKTKMAKVKVKMVKRMMMMMVMKVKLNMNVKIIKVKVNVIKLLSKFPFEICATKLMHGMFY